MTTSVTTESRNLCKRLDSPLHWNQSHWVLPAVTGYKMTCSGGWKAEDGIARVGEQAAEKPIAGP